MAQFLRKNPRPDDYLTAPDDHEPAAPEFSTATGKQIQFRVRLWSHRKLVDEEQGHRPPSINASTHSINPVRQNIHRRYSNAIPKTLEIVQTRSYPERDRQETLILTDRKLGDQGSNNDVPCEIHWIHQKADPDLMSFEEIKTVVDSEVPKLRKDEMALALRMLEKVHSTNGKPFVRGKYGKYLIPLAVRYNGDDPDLKPGEKPRHAILFSLPYFDLKPLTRLKPVAKDTAIYPTRTLLQSHHRLALMEERDKKQAFRKLGHSKNEQVLYLPQLWCLVINNKTILTYASTDTSGLFGKTITTEKLPEGPKIVRYRGTGGVTYHFPMEQCQTFGQLRQTIKLHEETFDHDLQTKDGQIISHLNWPEKISQKKSPHIDLFVPSEDSESGSETESDTQYVVIEPDQIRSLSPAPSEPDIVTIEPEPHNQWQDIDEIFEEFKRQQRTEGSDKVDDLEIPTIKPTGHHTPPLSEQVERLRGRTSPFASHNISSIRRAETIGLAPSMRQRLGFGLEPQLDRNEPRPAKRAATIDIDLLRTRIEPFQVEPRAQVLPPHHKHPHSGSPGKVERSRQAEAPRLGDFYERHEMRTSSRPLRKDSINRPTRGTSPSTQHSDHISHLPSSLRASAPAPFHPVSSSLARSMTPSAPTRPPKTKIEDESSPHHIQQGSQARSGTSSKASRKRGPSSAAKFTGHMFRLLKDKPSTIKENQTNKMAVSGDAAPTVVQSENAILNEKVQSHSQSRNGLHAPSMRESEDYQEDYAMAKMLDDTDNQLARSEESKETKYYNRVEKKSLKDVEVAMKELLKRHIPEPGVILSASQLNAEKVLAQKDEIIKIAKKLLEAFVPADYPYPVVEKFWGGVYLLLGDTNRQREYILQDGNNQTSFSDLSFILKESSEFLQMIEYIQTCIYPGGDGQQKPRYRIPAALFEAFSHLMMFFVSHGLARATTNKKDFGELSDAGSKCTDRCMELLIQARHQLIVILHTEDDGARVSYESLEPETILALVMENLLGSPLKLDNTDTEIVEAYSDYMLELEIRVQEIPSVKVFGDLKLLGEELDIIEQTVSKQLEIVLDYRQITSVANEDDSRENRYSTRLREIILARCTNSLRQKIEDFRELKEKAAYLQFSARQSISIRTESNEKAILIFTVVTVIFLPLSFVTGYLGMNVEDIRSMNRTQSLFWIISIPITFIIGTIAWVLLMGSKIRKWIFLAKTESIEPVK